MKSPKNASAIDRNLLSELYRIMLKIRLAEEKIAELYPTDKIQSPVHLSIGQEAVSAGVCKAMRVSDPLYGTYRGHGIYIAKGGTLKGLFAELYAKDTGCARGKGGSMHLVAPEVGLMGCSAIVASTIPLAAGHALAAKMQRKDSVAVAIFGDGAIDEGVFYETVNFALLKKLPVLFVLENNNYAIHSKVTDRHLKADLYKYCEGMGLEGRRLPGDDVEVVYSTMSEALQEIRASSRPLLLEYMTYRWYEHVGPNRDLKEPYRDQEKQKQAFENDGVRKSREQLRTRYSVPESEFRKWEEAICREINEAVEFAEKSPFPAECRLHEDLYKENR